MPWFKVDDQLAFHAKTLMAGNEAMGLWIRAASWSCAHLTDGFIPEAVADSMAKNDFAMRLLMAKLWEEAEGGYQFHDWSDFQPSGQAEAARRESVRKARSSAGKKGAASRWSDSKQSNLPSQTDSKPIANGMANAWQTDSPEPEPEVLITNVINRGHSNPKSARKKSPTPIPDNWQPSESHQLKAQELGVNLNLESQKFINHAQANDRRQVDWNKSFHGWLLKASEYATRPRNGGGSSYAQTPSEAFLDLARELHETDYGQQSFPEITQ